MIGRQSALHSLARHVALVLSLVGSLALPAVAQAACGESDTGFFDSGDPIPVGEEDCDGDGWTKAEGDCNDENVDVNPGKQVDRCDDSDDNDCDGYFNEECELSFARGTLLGGSACNDNSVQRAALLLLLPLGAMAARRRKNR